MEPGPAYPLFEAHPLPAGKNAGKQARCEWDLMKILRRKNALESVKHHRDTYVTRDDFKRIKSFGLNAVRLPIGYWIVLGTSPAEPYVGPALNYVDQAVSWAEEFGLEILLDLHGCPGGESGDAPCGRRQRPPSRWHWTSWNFYKSLKALKVLAQRYHNRSCVTGIEVCNEPSNQVPLGELCQYYDRAVRTIRKAGMHADSVAVVLPVFQRPMDSFSQEWEMLTAGKHQNVCFDVHYYHCFERDYNGKTLAQQLRVVQQNAAELRTYPCVVGEWSLALGVGACLTQKMSGEEIRGLFGRAQIEAYKDASHGWFFWNWNDGKGVEWDWKKSYAEGSLSGKAYPLPIWNGIGADPLEEDLDPAPQEPRIFMGDEIYLRTFQGYYVEVEHHQVLARWCDKGNWQRLVICPAADQPDSIRPVRNGDVVRFRAHTNCFLTLRGKVQKHRRLWAPKVPQTFSKTAKRATEFVLHVESKENARHRSAVWLESRASGHMLDADDEKLRARWDNHGAWQRFVLEKAQREQDKLSKLPFSDPGVQSRMAETPRIAKKRCVMNHRRSCSSRRSEEAMCSLPDTDVQSRLDETALETPCFRVVKRRRIVNHRDSLCSIADDS